MRVHCNVCVLNMTVRFCLDVGVEGREEEEEGWKGWPSVQKPLRMLGRSLNTLSTSKSAAVSTACIMSRLWT